LPLTTVPSVCPGATAKAGAAKASGSAAAAMRVDKGFMFDLLFIGDPNP
jgi:hypothetical protein